MGSVYLVFSSSTTAGRLKKLAGQEGIPGVGLVQTPKAISHNGCTYSIRCAPAQLSRLQGLAAENGIRYNKIYREIVGPRGMKTYEAL